MLRIAATAGALVTSIAVLGSAGQAVAATVTVGAEELELGGPPVIFSAEPGEVNDLTVSSIPGDPDAVVFRDAGAVVSAGAGCMAQLDGSVACRVSEIAGVRILLSDGDDRLDAAALHDQNRPPQSTETTFFAVEVDGAQGADMLIGADATFSCLRGGPGNDVITSAVTPSAPVRAICGPIGGEGNDLLSGGATGESFSGGPGVDTINAAGGDDFAAGGSDTDLIDLGPGPDAAVGGAGADRVVGDLGNDTLTDSRGADAMLGGDGDDLIEVPLSDDSGADELNGGSGFDAVKFTCASCQVSLNARGDDGERGGVADDNVLRIEQVVASSTRFDVIAEANVAIGRGDDVLSGDAGANVLNGTRGPDLITGGAGPDRLIGGPGPDLIRAADGRRDIVSCGGSRSDAASIDPKDSARGCERVRVRAPTTASRDAGSRRPWRLA